MTIFYLLFLSSKWRLKKFPPFPFNCLSSRILKNKYPSPTPPFQACVQTPRPSPQEKSQNCSHTQLATVNHRRPFSDFSWGETGVYTGHTLSSPQYWDTFKVTYAPFMWRKLVLGGRVTRLPDCATLGRSTFLHFPYQTIYMRNKKICLD